MEQVSVLETNIGSSTTGNSANTQIIFNDNGTLRGDAGLVYNKTTDALTVAGLVTAGSATITGDLTVDTSTLKVDSTNNRVGIGTASPADTLDVNGRITALRYLSSSSNAALPSFAVSAGNGAYNSGTNEIGFSINSTSAMTLNSTGLGVGASPANDKLLSLGSIGILLSGATSDFSFRNSVGTAIQRLRYTDATGALTIGSATATAYPVELGGNTTTRAVTIDASSNVGIGVTPSAWNSAFKAVEFGSGNALFSGSSGYSQAYFGNNVFYNTSGNYVYKNTQAAGMYIQNQGAHQWYNAPSGTAAANITFTQAMTLDASGNLLVGLTVDSYTPSKGVSMFSGNSSRVAVGHANGTLTGDYYHSFAYNSTLIGSISQNGTTGVLYNTSSDYRLKESVKPISGGLARVNALKPSIYNWKSDGSTGEGFLAHELAEVVPFAVSGEKDAVNADGTIKSQGIDMSRIVPILVAAIQELTARVQTLEAR